MVMRHDVGKHWIYEGLQDKSLEKILKRGIIIYLQGNSDSLDRDPQGGCSMYWDDCIHYESMFASW